jgi:hypothetical protein
LSFLEVDSSDEGSNFFEKEVAKGFAQRGIGLRTVAFVVMVVILFVIQLSAIVYAMQSGPST